MIFVIIPVHNRIESTLLCIASFYQFNSIPSQIIVVDDGSTDGTESTLKQAYPELTILRGNGKLFWTGAVKMGIDHARTIGLAQSDYILLLNNDVQFMERGTITALIEVCEMKNRRALVTPLVRDRQYPDRAVVTGTRMRSWMLNRTKHYFTGEVPKGQPSEQINVDFLTARCLLHPIEIFEIIGDYDAQNLPHYAADDEFSYRAKKNGFENTIVTGREVLLQANARRTGEHVNVFRRMWFHLFDIRSSINIPNKIQFARLAAPPVTMPSYILIGAAKSLLIAAIRTWRS